MQCHLTFFGEAIADGAFEFRVQREHGPEDFAERGEIVVGDPAAELQQLLIEDGRGIEDGKNIFRGNGRLAVVQFHDDAGYALLAEWDEDAPADHWRRIRGEHGR